ncbi:NAD-dependent epimerase/dehydratase family protein [Candidatus Pacearchaeota archaeon]|nr:NAD-dependent epimerase/dehydratase family protein [Candidatus Pacearchaeota archaeon]
MAIKRILVIGGNGYIGRALVKELNKEYEVSIMDRRKNLGNYKFVLGDLLKKESLTRGINNFDMVINLASVVRSFNKFRYRENVEGLKNLIDVLNKKKIKLIYFSTQNVNLRNKGHYARSKKAAEKLLINSDLDYMIIRPNFVYEIGKENYFYKMARMVFKFNFAFVIGNGDNEIQPVLREDLAGVVLKLVKNFKTGEIVEISGNQTTSINKVIEAINDKIGRKSLVIHFPTGIARIFRFLIPFDVDGFDEKRISNNPYRNYNFSSFYDNLNRIILICKSNYF